MSSICINTVARVGVGVVRRRVGTLASPNTHQPKMPHRITPSLRSGQALRHTCSEPFASAQGTLREEAAKGLSRWAERCFAALSMTAVACMLLPPAVTLSPCVALRGNSAKGLVLLAHGPDHALACAPSQHGHPYVEKRHVIFSMFAIALLFTLALFLFPLPVSAHTITNTGTGRIYGKLLNGTKRNAPVAGQSVTLQMAQGDNARDLTNVTTDTHGMFSFSGLNTDKTINYALYTLYQGAQYYTDLIDLSTKPVQQINLTIYDATTSVANIAIVQANVLIDKADAQKSLITISENFFFENLSTTTYVGSLQANGSKPNALRFSLPNNARNLSLRSGFNGYQVIQVDPGFATDAALPPGTSQFAFSFQVPYTTSSYDFSYTIVYPTVNLSLLVPLNIHASSAAMDSQGPVNANQRTFQQFNAKKLLADSQIHVRLDGLPVSQPAANPQPLNQNTLWIILALLLMLAIVSVTWFIYRFSRRQSITRQKQTPQTSRRGGSGVDVGKGPLGRPASNMDARQRPLGRPASSSSNDAHPSQKDQQEALLQELLNLDKAYEAGTIKKVEYEERRSRTKTELRSLMNKDFVEKSTTTKKTARSSGKGVT
jgi:hypothetical protein